MSRFFGRLSVAAISAALLLLAAPAAQAKIVCGGAAGDTCGKGQYCFHAEGTCRKPGAQGACKTRPKRCTREYRPVCGCDGRTYGNKCAAAAAGVSVLRDGRCIGGLKTPTRPRPELDTGIATPSPGDANVCGGIAGIRCRHGQYCHFKRGTCHIADRQGTCKRRPRACTREYRPVCGCNGKTYPNACTAAAAGMSIRHTGKCRDRNRLRLRR